MNKYLIAGLGNIGQEYNNTRHNVGFTILSAMATHLNFSFQVNKLANYASIKYRGKKIVFICPTTYMNLSGKAIRFYLQKEKIELKNLLVIVDEIALPFGKIRIRKQGSAAGHNGLKNIESTLETQNYARLRWGLGNNFNKGRQVEYVLSPFTSIENNQIKELMPNTLDAILSFCTQGIDNTMTQFNK